MQNSLLGNQLHKSLADNLFISSSVNPYNSYIVPEWGDQAINRPVH